MLVHNIELNIERTSEDFRINSHVKYDIVVDQKSNKYTLITLDGKSQFKNTFSSIQNLIKHLSNDSMDFNNQVTLDYAEKVQINGTFDEILDDPFYLEFRDKKSGAIIDSVDDAILENFSASINDNYYAKVLSYYFRNSETSFIPEGKQVTIDYSGNISINKECDSLSDNVEYIYTQYKKSISPVYIYNKPNQMDIVWRN